MYDKVKLSVRLQDGITDFFTSNVGLKQGCNLSPILFNLFINDINHIFDTTFCQPPTMYNLTLSNLLYADDLILISESSSGLQNCLDRLETYCKKWKLTVNTKKTKTMVVEKRQSSISKIFTFHNNPLEMCKAYPYLGTLISNNGKFKLNISEICKSASKAMYTLLGHVNKYSAGNISVLLELFDRMILPICTYNCEVWGASFFPGKFSREFLCDKQLKNPLDKLQCTFLKHILGVHSRVSNWAVESETNRNSIIVKIIKKMGGFLKHTIDSESPIVQDTLELAKQLHSEGQTSWFTSIVQITKTLEISFDQLAESKNDLNRTLNENLQKVWYLNRQKYTEGKLRLYTCIKEKPGFENYLNETNSKLRQAMTKIRISAHKFPVETGRFENKSLQDRICPLCCDGIGDETHYLLECKNKEITKTRSQFIKPFHNKWKGIEKLTKHQFCMAILACQNNDMITETGLLCHKIQEVFELVAL